MNGTNILALAKRKRNQSTPRRLKSFPANISKEGKRQWSSVFDESLTLRLAVKTIGGLVDACADIILRVPQRAEVFACVPGVPEEFFRDGLAIQEGIPSETGPGGGGGGGDLGGLFA